MHAPTVDRKADGGLAGAPGQNRAQEGIFDPDDRGTVLLRARFAAVGSGAVAPNADRIAVLRPADA